MRVFILDDEPRTRSTVRAYMEESDVPDIQFKEAGSIQESLDVLPTFQPDVALLDVELDIGTSFDLLSQLPQIDFKIIFVSTNDQFAIQAFKFQALDFILKPINRCEFKAAFKRAIHFTENPMKVSFEEVSQILRFKRVDKIVVRDQSSIYFLTLNDIVYCKSESNYTIFHFNKEPELVISKTLSECEELLLKSGFFRTHRSYLINMDHIKKFDKREGGKIQMQDDSTIPLSRSRKPVFLHLINRMSC